MDASSYEEVVNPLGIRLANSLHRLGVDPEKAGSIYQEWGNKKKFQETLFTFMIVEQGFNPDEKDEQTLIEKLDEMAA